MGPERDAQLRDQVVRLVGVLRDLAPSGRHVAADAVLWLDDLRDHVVGTGAEVLRLRRARPEPEPPAPAEVAGWVGGDAEPVLRDRGPLHGQRAFLVDAPGVRDAFDAWMAVWRPWAHRERARRAQDGLATRLTELAGLAAEPSRELVLGAGLLHLPAEEVHVHLVAQPVRIATDPATGDVVCTTTGPPRLEDGGSAALRERLRELVPDALAPGLAEFLTEWAAATTPGAVEAGRSRPAGPGPVPAAAPALVVRHRGAAALHRCYDEIERSLRDATRPVPPGLAQLVRPDRPPVPPAAFPDDPLLPLPATEEQTRVVTALAAGSGVVVEGPPGTGKTHTLANLLGALLAAGQRVLVTSGDAGSLRVLRDRLPPGLQDLCVGLEDTEEGNGVARVAGERTEFDPVRAERRIADLVARRADATRTRDDLLAQVALLREAEARVYPDIAPGFGGTPAQIAAAVLRSAPRDAWVPGPVRGQPPVSGPEFAELTALLAAQTPSHRGRRDRTPVPAPLSVEGLTRIADAVARGPQLRPGPDTELVTALGDLPPDALTALESLTGEVIDAIGGLRSVPDPQRWGPATADRLLAEGPSRAWLDAVAELDAVDVAIDHQQRTGGSRIEIAEGTDEFAAAQVFEQLAGHLDGGAGLKRVFKGGEQRAAEKLGPAVLVDGAPPRSRGTALAAVHHLAVRRIAGRIDDVFAPLGSGIPYGPHAVESMLHLRSACAAVERVTAAAGAVGRVLVELPPPARPSLGSAADLERVARLGTVARAARAARAARREVDAAVAVLDAVPPVRRVPEQAAVSDALRALDVPAYTAAVHALDVARQEHRAQLRADELLEQVRAAAPALAAALVDGSAVDPQRWDRAWARARAVTWLDQQPGADAGARLDAELAVATGVVQSLTTELAVARAWRACLGRIDTTQARALQAYRHAAAQARAGTGEGAQRLRSSARDAMAVALSAVPAWVLPMPALLETIAHRPGSFDVVIVDEATRLDPSSAFLLWLAPRIVVVGDDGQCPPPVCAPDPAAAALPDVPAYLRAALGPDGTLFSLLRTRLDTVVRLREHFRGVPEIAAWSAAPREAPPVPLRRAGADGVPPLRSTHVPGRGRVRVLAETVAACAADPAYAGRTFGVVVPGGRGCVEAVGAALAERLAPAEWAVRRLRVGSPQDLRGDERDVVWLPVSGVGPPQHGPVAAQDYELAVSRARDQLWVVHSVRPDQLSPGDVRRSLLEHVLAVEPVLGPVPAGVRLDRRDDRFDSLFEQAVFLDLVERGFHVVPQVTCNRRRIDLVVTGAGGTLAVECDGEAFRTTPEQRAADLAREQELTACGWAFVRVRESVHLLDPDAALAPVWAALAERGIEPLGELVDGEWTVRVGVTEALPVLDVATEETAVFPSPVAPVSPAAEPPTVAVPVARAASGPDDSGARGFDAAAAMVRPRGFGTAAAADRRAGVGSGGGPGTRTAADRRADAGAAAATDRPAGVGSGGTAAERTGGAAAADRGVPGSTAGVAVADADPAPTGPAVPPVAVPPVGPDPAPAPGPVMRTAEPVTPRAWSQVPDGVTPAGPGIVTWMPGPRVSADPGAEPVSSGRHALREPVDAADPRRTPAPLFDAERPVAAVADPAPAVEEAEPGPAAPGPTASGAALFTPVERRPARSPEDLPPHGRAAAAEGPGPDGPAPQAPPAPGRIPADTSAGDPVAAASTVGGRLPSDGLPNDGLLSDRLLNDRLLNDGLPNDGLLNDRLLDDPPSNHTPTTDRPSGDRPSGAPVPDAPVPDPALPDARQPHVRNGSPPDDPPPPGLPSDRLRNGPPPHAAPAGDTAPAPSHAGPVDPVARDLFHAGPLQVAPQHVGPSPVDHLPAATPTAEPGAAASAGPPPGDQAPPDPLPADPVRTDPATSGPAPGDLASARHRVDAGPSSRAPRAAPPVTDRERATLLDVARRRPLTTAAVRNLLGVGAGTARDLLADLAGEGTLVRRGDGRTTHWVPAETDPADRPRRRTGVRPAGRAHLWSAG